MEKNVQQYRDSKDEQGNPWLIEEAIVAGEDKVVCAKPLTKDSKLSQV